MNIEEFVYFVIKAGVYPPERVSQYYTRKHDAKNRAKNFNRWDHGEYKVAKSEVEIVEVFDE